VKRILNEAYTRATTTLTERREQLDAIADALLEEEIIDGERVLSITGQEVDHPV
jgi:ATP-dependent Zn protease